MKKIIALILAAILCLSLTACSDPLSKEYANIDEAALAIAENYKNPKTDNLTIRDNSSLAQYFQKDHAEDEMWKKLLEVKDESGNSLISLSEIHTLYNFCNQENGFDDWFEFININIDGRDGAFIMYGNSGLTEDKLQDKIGKGTVDNSWVCFKLPDGASSADDFTVYDRNCEYKIMAEVDGEIYLVTGNVAWSSWTFSVKSTGLSSSLLTAPAVQEGYGAWQRLL